MTYHVSHIGLVKSKKNHRLKISWGDREKRTPTHCQWRSRWEEAGDNHQSYKYLHPVLVHREKRSYNPDGSWCSPMLFAHWSSQAKDSALGLWTTETAHAICPRVPVFLHRVHTPHLGATVSASPGCFLKAQTSVSHHKGPEWRKIASGQTPCPSSAQQKREVCRGPTLL